MKWMAYLYLVVSVAMLLPHQCHAQGYLKVQGKTIVDASGRTVLLRGMGLGGWMLQEPYMLNLSGVTVAQYDIKKRIKDLIGEKATNRFYQQWLANHCTRRDVDSLAAWGFNSVRLPMHYNLFTLPIEQEPVAGKNTWLKTGFELTDSLLSWCSANKMYLILDLHAAPGGQGFDMPISDRDSTKSSLWQNEANSKKTIDLWKELAKRYKNERWIGGYDIINEPNWGFTDANDRNGCKEELNAPLRKLLEDISTAIRSEDKNHIIFIEGNCWANNYKGIFPLWDNNMVVSFHKYWNHNNVASIQSFLDIREKYNVPLWMGESGENSNVWFTEAISLLEAHDIGWAWWPLKKFGGNNPFMVNKVEGYDKIIEYWKGKAAKPTATEAAEIFTSLTAAVNAKENKVNRDVVDAMFRQVHTTATLPFMSHLVKDKSIVYASDYDLGRNGFAYYDADTANYWVSTNQRTEWNKGKKYRNDGVDIDVCTDSVTNGYQVTSTEAGEWLKYTVDVAKDGLYTIQLRAKTIDATSKSVVALSVDNKDNGSIIIANKAWEYTPLARLQLVKGTHTVLVKIIEGGALLNNIRFLMQPSNDPLTTN